VEFNEFLEQFNKNEAYRKDVYKKYSYAVQEDSLEPLQVELIKLQDHLEKHQKKNDRSYRRKRCVRQRRSNS